MRYDVVIIGAGPGGLRCGKILADNGISTLILERKKQIGKKVCAGGITWRGLIKTIPEAFIECTFNRQVITTRYQKAIIEETMPMVATVSRKVLGTYMAEQAETSGAEVISGAFVNSIEDNRLVFRHNGTNQSVQFDFLVGADGSNSLVRKYLGLVENNTKRGVGLQYTVSDAGPDMIWNFDSALFNSGYSWVFPHSRSASVGTYIGTSVGSAKNLKNGLDHWVADLNIDISGCKLEAELVNWDYQGWKFDRFFLVGDAAGLASPLTGEGINPAFVSGETVARTIINPGYETDLLNRIVSQHRSHQAILKTAGRSRMLSMILSELCSTLLRCRLINFKRFEMA